MSLLPKAAEEFRNRDYWDQFFAKVGAEAFEWYSDFVDLANVLCKYIKARDEVLVIGCGNSTLSSDLYDTGIEQITNIDLSEKVIKQMRKQNEKKRANMKWLSMDARKMTFNDQQFSVVLDKGTIDALMSNRTEQVLNDINQILGEVDRVLRPTGRFICITLAQKHILDHLSEYFFHQKSWLLRYHHIQTSKSFALPVFAFVFTKMTLKTPLIEVQLYSDAEKNWLRFHDLSNALDAIRQCQITCFRKYDFKQKFVPGSETPLIDLYDERDQTKRRYQMIVTNSRTKYRNRLFAAFIVPKSRNLDWLYSTVEGRQQILSTAQYTTMVFIYLQPDQEYRDLEQVKAEMTNAVLDFKPAQSSENLQIPFLSSSEGIGDVKIREESATFIIEDCLSSGEGNGNRWKRRLRFHSNPNLIQSEVHLRFDSTSNELQPDYSIVDDDYHGAMIACLQGYFKSSPQGQWLLIGLGGGVLSMKLLRAFPKIRLTGVDIDAEMLRLAKKWFGLDDQRSTCVIEDGLQYLDRQVREKISFDVIIIDVNNDDNQSSLRCPHPSFLNDSVLSNVHQLLSSSSSGLFLLNFASRDPSSPDRDRCRTELLQHFSHLSSLKLDEDINEIFLCSEQSLEKISMNKSIDSNLKELFEKLRLEK